MSHNQKIKTCESCRDGEIYDYPADYYVTGTNPYGRPFRGYLCDEHLEIWLEDGANVKYIPLPQSDKAI